MRHALFLNAMVIAMFATGTASASARDTLTDVLLQNEIRVESDNLAPAQGRIVVLVDLLQSAEASGVRKDFISQLVKTKLTNSGIAATRYHGDFREDLLGRKVAPVDLISTKLVAEINVDPDDPRLGYSSDCSISLIEYTLVPGSKGRFKGQRNWFKRQTLKGISRQDIEDNLVQYIQKELGGFVTTYRSVKEREKRREAGWHPVVGQPACWFLGKSKPSFGRRPIGNVFRGGPPGSPAGYRVGL